MNLSETSWGQVGDTHQQKDMRGARYCLQRVPLRTTHGLYSAQLLRWKRFFFFGINSVNFPVVKAILS